MSNRDNYYNLLATLHDQLEDIETYDRYLRELGDDSVDATIWRQLKTRTEEDVELVRAELERLAPEDAPDDR